MILIKIFLSMILFVIFNKILIYVRKMLENKFKIRNMEDSIINRQDLVEFGMDYYLNLCKYIIIQKNLSKEVQIQDITGREIVDIKFTNMGNQVYSSCILKDFVDSNTPEGVSYSEVLDLMNFMIKDNVTHGLIFSNSDFDEDALNYINDLNKNSKKYKIEIIDGYEIIKYARLRNEKSEGGFIYA